MSQRGSRNVDRAASAPVRRFISSHPRLILLAAIVVLIAAAGLVFALSRDGRSASTPSASTAGPAAVANRPADASAEPSASSTTKRTRTAAASTQRPAPKASKPTTLPTAPDRALGSLLLPKGVSKARLDVVFDVYGWGPNGPDGAQRLIVRVTSSKPVDAGSKVQDLTGQNAMFSLASYEGPPTDEGGRYQGTIEARANGGDRGFMYLVDARPMR